MNIIFSPSIGQVDSEMVLTVGGDLVGTELRWKVLSQPPGSTFDYLTTESNGAARFTPTIAGEYSIQALDVTVTQPTPNYDGHVVDNVSDNEDTCPSVNSIVYVAQKVKRNIGLGQNQAELSFYTYQTRVKPSTTALGNLNSEPAKLAQHDPAIKAILTEIDSIDTDVLTDMVFVWSSIQSAIDAWNGHIGKTGNNNVHIMADATNTLASVADVSSLSGVLTRLDDMVAKYNAHRVDAAFHNTADITYIASSTDPETGIGYAESLDALTRYYKHVYTTLTAHGQNSFNHTGSILVADYADGNVGNWQEWPVSNEELFARVNTLTSLYTTHLAAVTQGTHAAADTTNTVVFAGTSVEDMVKTVNAWAESINRHIQNQDSTGAAAGSPYHNTGVLRTRLVQSRAGDASTVFLTAEECYWAMIEHMASSTASGQHTAKMIGKNALFAAPNLILRLQRRWQQLTDSTTPNTPAGANVWASSLLSAYGWS